MPDIKRTIFITPYLILFMWLLCLLLVTNISHASWNPNNVIGTSECAECHESEVDVWKKTAHQKNFRALSKNKDAKKIAEKMGIKRIKKDSAMCSSCHYTVGNKKGKTKIIAGVSCESCHAPAKDWLQVHSDFGGKGITAKTESASHKQDRYKKLENLNMIRPDNTYEWAKNCLNCHIVANEKLINTGGHETGNDFNLTKRSQGKIRHYPKADDATIKYYNLISYSTELEVTLLALAEATGGKYASEMQKRANETLKNLKKANNVTPDKHVSKIISVADKANIKPGNKQLLNTAKSISIDIMQMVQKKTGYVYDSNKLILAPQKIVKEKPAQAPIKKTVKNTTPKKKPVTQTKPATKAKNSSVTKPVPAKQTKKPIKAITVPTDKPVQKTITTNSNKTSETTIQPKETGAQLLEEFNIVIPGNNALCQTYTPWARGKQKLKHNTGILQNGCFGIDIKSERSAQFYLFAESKNNNLVRLVPNNCNYLGIKRNTINANQTVNIPGSNNSNPVVGINGFSDYNKLYVIIADNAYANSEMSRLSASTASMCNSNESKTENNNSTQGLDGMLDALKKSADGHLDWRMQKFR